MSSLVFRALDHHVVGGLADHPALMDERGPISFAELLHESASVAGALGQLGVLAGTEIALEVSGRERVIAVLACARVGAVPRSDAEGFRLTGVPPVLHTPDTEAPWDLLIRAGRTDPAPAPGHDADGYEQLLLANYADVFAPLIAGRTI